MQTKYKIDRDARTLILKYIRKYDEYRLWYNVERDRILYPSRPLSDTPPQKNHAPGNSTLSAVEALERLDSSHRAKVVKAIDLARFHVGVDIPDERQLLAMRRAVWLSCLDADEYPFEVFEGAICCERRQFFNYKNAFLNDIKNLLGI